MPERETGRQNAQMEFPRWQSFHAPYEAGLRLHEAEREILSMVQRVVIRGGGWGPFDCYRGTRRGVKVDAEKLANKGSWSKKTYERARARLVRLGLLEILDRDGRHFVYGPAWWEPSWRVDADGVFAEAARRAVQGAGRPR